MQQIGKSLIFLGAVIMVIGFVIVLAGKFNIPFGNLPGDITYQKKNFTVFAPIGSMLVISIVISVILNIISRWKN